MHQLGAVTPNAAEFAERAQAQRVIPVSVKVLADGHTPLSLYRALTDQQPGSFLMESAAPGAAWNRFSFVGVSSPATLTERDGRAQWLGDPPAGTPTDGSAAEVLRETLDFLAGGKAQTIDTGFPHMTSGLVGYLGWDMIRHWEKLPHPPEKGLNLPDMAMHLVGDLAVHDNRDGTVTLIANAINHNGESSGVEQAYADAVSRLQRMREELSQPVNPGVMAAQPQWQQAVEEDLTTRVRHTWDESEYLATLQKAKEAIVDGEVFQIVVSRRFEIATQADPLSIYRMLRLLNPSPYMYLMPFRTPEGELFQVVGASPEALVTVDADRHVISHPIAGSRPRGADEAEDHALAQDLLADQKERAEHLMLVDLARNDLAKVCVPGSVEVTRFMAVETFSHVMHMTSHVVGEVEQGQSSYDVLAATFPAGTLSGAPKPRALQLLDEWEPTRRGVYGGVVGYFDLSGRMDAAIAIRSAVLSDGHAYVQAGGGIVADSDDDAERQETVNKAAAPIRAVLAADRLIPVEKVVQ